MKRSGSRHDSASLVRRVAAGSGLLLALGACEPQPPAATPGATASPSATPAACVAKPGWFPVAARPPARDFPAEPTNCDFHQYAWQMFLWLTERSDPEDTASPLNFETLAYPRDLFTKKGGKPPRPYPGRDLESGRVMNLLARVGKTQQSVDPDDVFQAGPGMKILIDQKGWVVYYSTHLDEVYWDFAVENELYLVKKLNDPGVTNLDFPPDSVELKASWRIAEVLDKATGKVSETLIENAGERFYTTRTTIRPVALKDGSWQEDEDPSKAKLVTIALTGMHVTFTVAHHPEFIWATFEHEDNAPDCAATPTAGVNAATGERWSLYKADTPAAANNQFDESNPLAPVSVCRQYPWGGGPDENLRNIQSLNASVRPELRKGRPVWAHYELVGGVWTTGDGMIPGNNGAPEDMQRGSLKLSNTTMETFTQDANCFACHNRGRHVVAVGEGSQTIGAKHVNLSHFVVNYQASQQAHPGPDGSSRQAGMSTNRSRRP